MSNRLTIQQVADELKVSTKTLRRWEESGYLVPEREPNTNVRLYHPYLIGYWKKLLELDRALRSHLKLLDDLRKELDKYMATKALPNERVPLMDIEKFGKAHDDMMQWEKEYKKLFDEIMEYPKNMLKATADNYDDDQK